MVEAIYGFKVGGPNRPILISQDIYQTRDEAKDHSRNTLKLMPEEWDYAEVYDIETGDVCWVWSRE